MKRYDDYKPTGLEWLPEIPAGWEIKKLKWICSLVYGESLSSELREEGDIPVFGSNGVTGYHNFSITGAPCVVIGRKGSFGKINYSEIPCFPIDTTYFIDNKSTNNDLRWLYYVLGTLGLDQFSRDTGVPGLSREDAYSNSVALPPLSEQHAIACFLDAKTAQLDQLIAQKQQMLALLREERAALINHAVTKGLDAGVPMRDSGVEWLGEVPAHWEVKRLKHLLTGLEQGWSPSCESREADPGEWGVLKVGCVNGLRFNPSENKALPADLVAMPEYEVKPGDFLISRANTKELVGSASLVENVRPKLMLCDKLFRLFFAENANKEYILLVVGSDYGRSQIQMACSGASSSMQNISQEFLKNMVILLPKQDEQRAIVEYVAEQTCKIEEIGDSINKEIALLQEYRAALIAEAVTGQIDVRHYEPALEVILM